jgi:hypothetical protein
MAAASPKPEPAPVTMIRFGMKASSLHVDARLASLAVLRRSMIAAFVPLLRCRFDVYPRSRSVPWVLVPQLSRIVRVAFASHIPESAAEADREVTVREHAR